MCFLANREVFLLGVQVEAFFCSFPPSIYFKWSAEMSEHCSQCLKFITITTNLILEFALTIVEWMCVTWFQFQWIWTCIKTHTKMSWLQWIESVCRHALHSAERFDISVAFVVQYLKYALSILSISLFSTGKYYLFLIFAHDSM